MKVEFSEKARYLRLLMAFRSSKTRDAVMTVVSFIEWAPFVRVNI